MSGNYLLHGLAVFLLCGCGMPSGWVTGLSPKNPPAQVQSGDIPAFSKVESLQPKLQWESFSEHAQRESNEKIDKKVGSVTYELKIWELKKGYPIRWSYAQRNVEPGELIYSRKALPQPWHIVEQPLEPSTNYIWTIRARYKYNGTERLTEWGQQLVRPPHWFSYFGFQTPSK